MEFVDEKDNIIQRPDIRSTFVLGGWCQGP
jgi:hypothetical protein